MKRGVVGPRRPGATSLSSHAGTDVAGPRPRKPTQFDDQRPGWDFTSGDVGKFKLTEEQVKVRRVRVSGGRVAPRRSSPSDVLGSRAARTPRSRDTDFLNFRKGGAHLATSLKRDFRVSARVPRLTRATLRSVTPPPQARRALHTSKHLADAKTALAGRSAAKISVRPGKRDTHRVVDKTDFEGSDAESRDLSPSPPRAAPRGRGAPGAGLGPVRFADAENVFERTNATTKSDAATAKKAGRKSDGRAPLSHEAETSMGRRMLGEPPGWRNPRARVPFREARVRRQSERGVRKERALARAAGEGWAPTRAPEWNNPNGTGKAVRAPRERRGDAPGAPTVAFEEEFEQFKMMKLRERAASAAESRDGAARESARRFARGAYAAVGSDEDVDDDDDDASFRSDGVEQEEESEGERGETERASTLPRSEAESAATASLLKRHELIRREFGKETSPEAPERPKAFGATERPLDPLETEMAKVFAFRDGDAFPSAPDASRNAIDAIGETTATKGTTMNNPDRADPDPEKGFGDSRARATHVPAALRFAPPPEPEPSRERALWPTPFGRPANDVPFRVVAEHVGASYPAPPPEERGLPRYAERNEGRKKGLASLAFARSVGTGTVGAAGFGLGADGGHAPDPRALRLNEGVETLGLGPLPPGFLASREIQQLAETLAKQGDYEGGGGRVDRDIAAGVHGGADESSEEARAATFRKRVSASKRAVTANVEAGLAGRSPAGGALVDLVPEEDAEASAPPPGPGAPGDTPATRAPVTSGSQTMSLNAHAWTGYD